MGDKLSLSADLLEPKQDFLATTFAVLIMVGIVGATISDAAPTLGALSALLAAVSTAGIVTIASIQHPQRTAPLLVAVAALILLTLLAQLAGETQQFDVLLRYLTSIAVLFAVHLAPLPDLRRVFSVFGIAVIVYAAVVSLSGGAYGYAGTVRLQPFWSGVASSSLAVAGLTVVVALSPMKRLWKSIWVSLGFVLVAGYGVVTTMIMVAVFFGGWYFLRKGWSRVWLYLLAIASIVGGILYRDDNAAPGADIASLGFGAIGSGRFDAWLGRFQEFTERDTLTKLIGLGPYSDYQFSALWSWEAKNAHSDLVTLLMEFGLVGLGVLVAAGVFLYKRVTEVGQLALLAIAVGAAASNAFLDRPTVAAVWGIVLYTCAYYDVVRFPTRTKPAKNWQPSRHASKSSPPVLSR